MIKKIIEFLIKILTYKTAQKEEKPKTEANTPTEEETPKSEPETKPNEIIEDKPIEAVKYQLLSVKDYQKQLKKIGLYTLAIDGNVGNGTKKAIKQFNIIFLNSNSEKYSEDTDKILRVIYSAYSKSVYMTEELWKYFKSFKKTEYRCLCNGKYCNGYPHSLSIHAVMADQYARNLFNKPCSITSGLRCQKHNDSLSGSVKNSHHIVGRASDGAIKPITASELMKVLKELPFVSYQYKISANSNYHIHKSVTL